MKSTFFDEGFHAVLLFLDFLISSVFFVIAQGKKSY